MFIFIAIFLIVTRLKSTLTLFFLLWPGWNQHSPYFLLWPDWNQHSPYFSYCDQAEINTHLIFLIVTRLKSTLTLFFIVTRLKSTLTLFFLLWPGWNQHSPYFSYCDQAEINTHLIFLIVTRLKSTLTLFFLLWPSWNQHSPYFSYCDQAEINTHLIFLIVTRLKSTLTLFSSFYIGSLMFLDVVFSKHVDIYSVVLKRLWVFCSLFSNMFKTSGTWFILFVV